MRDVYVIHEHELTRARARFFPLYSYLLALSNSLRSCNTNTACHRQPPPLCDRVSCQYEFVIVAIIAEHYFLLFSIVTYLSSDSIGSRSRSFRYSTSLYFFDFHLLLYLPSHERFAREYLIFHARSLNSTGVVSFVDAPSVSFHTLKLDKVTWAVLSSVSSVIGCLMRLQRY